MRLIIYNRFSRLKNWGVKVVVIASKQEFPNITDRLLNVTRLGFIPVGIFCTDYKQNEAGLYKGIPVSGFSYEECKKLRDGGIDFAFYASANLSYEDEVLTAISRIFPAVYYVLPESDLSSLWVETTDMLGRPVLKVSYHLFEKVQNSIKRIIEVAMAVIALIITLPLSLLLMLLLALEKKGPVFYEQRRLGLNGKQFQLIKFRTMVSNADSVFEQHLNENPEARREYEQFHKLKNDPRITRIGSFIRKYSLDEIPQLINVVSGDMNLIGPRAYMVNEVDLQEEDYRTILKVRPGVTGWWQVMGRNNTTFVERKNLDLYYIKNWSLWLDYYILIKTGWIILSGQGK